MKMVAGRQRHAAYHN